MNKHFSKMGAIVMATAATAGSVVSAFATNATNDAITNKDIINSTLKGSLTVHKYDMTAAAEAGAYTMGSVAATGEQSAEVEAALADFAIQGVIFSYLKVGNALTYTDGENVHLVYEIPAALGAILGVNASDVDMTQMAGGAAADGTLYLKSDTISNALAGILASGNTAAKNALEAYAKANGATNMTETNASGYSKASDLDLGLYLVVETFVPEDVTVTTDPFFAQLPFTDVTGENWLYDLTVYPKNKTGNPTIDKLVRSDESDLSDAFGDTATASVGDTLDYQVVVKMPEITSDATKLSKFTIVDTMINGLTYDENAVLAVFNTAEDARSGDVTKASAVFGATDAGTGNVVVPAASISHDAGTNVLTVDVTGDALAYLNGLSEKYVTVLYTCTVNDDAVLGDIGNDNDVALTWARSNMAYANTIEDEAIVWSYGVNLTKTFSDGATDAEKFAKVKFVVENTTDGYYVTADQASDGVYYVTGKADSKAAATHFVPAADGNLEIHGLEADTYTMVETNTAPGYSLLKQPISIVISGTERTIEASKASITKTTADGWVIENVPLERGDIVEATATIDGNDATMLDDADNTSANAFVELAVVNMKGFTLPQTGGAGLYAVTIAGVVATAAGGFAATRKKKTEESK